MDPYWKSADGKHAIWCADCLDVLPTLGKVDMVLTDPPYGNNYSTGRRKGIYRPSTKITGDVLSEPILNDVADKLQPILNDVACVYWFAAPDRLDMVLPIIRKYLQVINVLCWDKGNCTAGDLDASYGKQWEAIVFARNLRQVLLGGRDRDILRFNRGDSAAYVHPTQKPIELFEYLIGRHDADTVLDQFMGSGTTGVACVKTGRRFLGIEREQKYCDIAVKRMEKALEERAASFDFMREPEPVQATLWE